ncbi:MAG: hypothetical protein ACU84J_14075 [Gammaproteobacteria bacterium]
MSVFSIALAIGNMRFLSFVRKNWVNVLLAVVFLIALVKLLDLYFSAGIDDGEWDAFKAEHHCRLEVNDKGSQRLSWRCDDGETHYRWRQQR